MCDFDHVHAQVLMFACRYGRAGRTPGFTLQVSVRHSTRLIDYRHLVPRICLRAAWIGTSAMLHWLGVGNILVRFCVTISGWPNVFEADGCRAESPGSRLVQWSLDQ